MQLCRRRVSHSRPLPRPPPLPRPRAPGGWRSTKPSVVTRRTARRRAPGRARGEAPAAAAAKAASKWFSTQHPGQPPAGCGTAGRKDRRRAATHRRRKASRPTPAGGQSGTHGCGSWAQGRSSRGAEGLHWLKQETLPPVPLPPPPPPSPPPGKKEEKKESWAAVAGKSPLSHLPALLSLPSPRQVRTRQGRQPGPAAQTLSACSGRRLPGLDLSGCFLSPHPT